MNQYPTGYGQKENDPLQGEIDIVIDIRNAYPGKTFHEIAHIAITTGNESLLRSLTRYRYLPIRWSAFIDIASTNMILIFYDMLSYEEKKRASYKMRLPGMIERFPVDQELAIRYSYAPYIPRNNLEASVRVLDADRVILLVNKGNLEHVLDLVFRYGRIDVLNEILLNRRESEIEPMLFKYTNMFLPVSSMNYLFDNNLYQNDNIQGIPLQIVKAIVSDDPSLLEGIVVPNTQIMGLIFSYDADDILRKLKPSIPNIDPSWKIYGNCLRFILETVQSEKIEQLIPHMDASNMDFTLSLHKNNNPLRLKILIEAAKRGYIEILNKYMQRQDIPDIIVVAISENNIDLFQRLLTRIPQIEQNINILRNMIVERYGNQSQLLSIL